MLNSVLQNAIGTRNVLLMAGALYGGGSLLISFAPPFPAVMVGLCLMGFGGGFYEASLTSVVSHFEDSRFMNILYAFFGWLTSYLMNVKGSGPDISRYQLSMLWAGLTAGRVFFSLPFIHVRERTGNTLLLVSMCGAIGLFWAVNSTPSNWITVAAAGFFLGPNTPGIMSIVSARVPPSLKGIVVSVMIGLGLAGTLAPMVFGVVIEKVGPGLRILPPVVIILASLSGLVFWAIPPRRKVD
ncbi:unnamed protein product [Rhizoctonia solani]|uniref:Major facilitator superfamily (MFS) profile domain-containing protein n=1 Tax=Rhizoctonia solani TaxID=456999 RepID=A0A8H3A8T6_9AGAM|nr:unnamed protein product [Rhizoctonia solani]